MLKGYFGRFEHGYNYELEPASNAAEAVAALRRGRPDLILLDPQMKGLNGLALLKQVRTIDRSIPVIVITGTQASSVIAEALSAGVFAYAPKPCDFQQLEHLIALVFGVPSRATP
jgi:DNA-binding NtrC family response regulator